MKHKLNTDFIFKNKSAWIVEWLVPPYNSVVSKSDLRPYILPYRWNSDHVFDFMRCLFWNSALWVPNETVRQINETQSGRSNAHSILRVCEGGRLSYGVHGEAYWLIAARVKNLCGSRNDTGEFILKWTRPARANRNHKSGLIEFVGDSVDREWIQKENV